MVKCTSALRAFVFHDFKNGLTPSQCLVRLQKTFAGESIPSKRTIQRWFSDLRAGRSVLEDLSRAGRRPTAVTPDKIIALCDFVIAHPHASYAQIRHAVDIGSSQCTAILKWELGMKKICSRWVPHTLTVDQKQARLVFCQNLINVFGGEDEQRLKEIVTGDEMWGYYYNPLTKRQSMEWVKKTDPRPLKVRRSRSVRKTMFIVFFNSSGVVSILKLIPTPGRRTINAAYYVKTCLKKLVQKLRKKRGKTGFRGLKLHHNNASSHTCSLTTDFLQQEGLKLLPHPVLARPLTM
ncbi:putative Histone-lysine N-methyltransferase SETMAR [Hypsibius exemplaris]|uniref:Histone-lysine N-methyltransferase SETMAR n=1 Tax=Hypsibius exemplaris TaxID=2072580 RepID=A0A9X6NIQ5_HYPEX|nr:putative Histone-lysine N-methyltransferase SETMAR [Hypsibius exemplaris]